MGLLTRLRIFHKAAVLIFVVYMGTMLYVVVTCFSRHSGNTGLDMSKVQQMRYEAGIEDQHISEAQ